jgi:hypothetical protein
VCRLAYGVPVPMAVTRIACRAVRGVTPITPKGDLQGSRLGAAIGRWVSYLRIDEVWVSLNELWLRSKAAIAVARQLDRGVREGRR